MTQHTRKDAEVPFTLPQGFVDAEGVVHRDGTLRLTSGPDQDGHDARDRANPDHLLIERLSRAVVRLGGLEHVDTATIEGLCASDLWYLDSLQRRAAVEG
ncbi:phage tail assembly protein [Pseudonocardia sp.]|uniref:phage tail assembly protein n=1 Tax=Pseudonocardia sp. TaxID=60912 RepID=UPI0026128D1D|nr:phage tail assembly protein [Pseudonocardia sp.]MCW2718876.1 secreted protein [Pseudonocardia sp.]MDT7613910.1 hypothetical protein [Pseudonocardiales bacterium]